MKLRSFVVPGDPVAQGRPRFSVRGGFARVYDPAKSRSYKAVARDCLIRALAESGHGRIDDGPIGVSVEAYFERPKSKCSKIPRGLERQASRPDAENVAKIILDAANGIAWRDDAQVSKLTVSKFIVRQGDAPRVVVRFMPIDVEVEGR